MGVIAALSITAGGLALADTQPANQAYAVAVPASKVGSVLSPGVGVPSCSVSGRVTDSYGEPLAQVHVQLVDDGDGTGPSIEDSATQSDGTYRFEPLSAGRKLRVRLLMAEQAAAGVGPGRFKVTYHEVLGEQQSPALVTTAGLAACKVNFALDGLDHGYTYNAPASAKLWSAMAAIYIDSRRAENYAANVFGIHVDYGLPLPVRAWCDESGGPCDGPTSSLYAGSRTDRPAAAYPYVALGTDSSSAQRLGYDDSLYHEFGHAMATEAFGNTMPQLPRTDRSHGGYYINLTSTDAWEEGFATFYAWLVSRTSPHGSSHADMIDYPGWRLPLEADHQTRVWDSGRVGEELAVSAALVDMVDGAGDYRQGRLLAHAQVTVQRQVDGPQTMFVGRVRGVDGRDGLSLTAQLFAGRRKVATQAQWLGHPDHDGSVGFVIAASSGVSVSSIRTIVRAGRATAAHDDDPLSVSPADLWNTISSYRRSVAVPGESAPGEFPYVYDVTDLHAALSARFSGDRDHNGIDDVDQIFIAHGLFADLNGNRLHDVGEAVGPTSHPEVLGVGGKIVSPAAIPRRSVSAPADWLAQFRGSYVPTQVTVVVQFPPHGPDQGYQYGSTPDRKGHFIVSVPPLDSGARVTVVAQPSGRNPVVVDDFSAADFWAQRADPSHRDLLRYTLERSQARGVTVQRDVAAPVGASHSSGWQKSLLVVVVAMSALVLLLIALRLIRRRSNRSHDQK